jgi:hypothetical protein
MEVEDMANLALILVDVVSAVICFVLLKFMIKPYRTTGEGRYLGLPLGFAFLGVSYVLMGCTLFLNSFSFVEELQWAQILTQSYAFAFLATTYYFSKKPTKNMRLWWNITYAALFFAILFLYLIALVPPHFELPSYQIADHALRIFNILFLAYISIHTLRSHVSHPDPKTIWIPFAYMLLGFGQYSLLIWSLDSSFSAYIGAYVLRLAGLLIFLFVTYWAFYVSLKKGVSDEKTPA